MTKPLGRIDRSSAVAFLACQDRSLSFVRANKRPVR
jgi:hypothetical protein